MTRKHDTKKVREAIGALDDLGVDVPEILRRLQQDDGGIGYPVDISRRAVYYHRTKHREAKARASTALDTAAESVAAAKQRAIDLLCRELHKLEQIPPGKMTAYQVPVVERIHKALAHMERDEKRAAKRSGQGSGGPPKADEHRELTALELLAREEAKKASNGAEPPSVGDNGVASASV